MINRVSRLAISFIRGRAKAVMLMLNMWPDTFKNLKKAAIEKRGKHDPTPKCGKSLLVKPLLQLILSSS